MFKKIGGYALVLTLSVSTILSGANMDAKKKKVKKPSIAKSTSIAKGKTKTIKVKNAAKKAKFTWKLSKKKIVSIKKKKKNACTLKALKNGTVTLSCKVKQKKFNKTLKCKVKVYTKRTADVSMYQAYNGIFNYVGAAVNYGTSYARELRDPDTFKFVKKHYNSFTLENEMKPDNILGSVPKLISVADAKKKGYYIPADYADEKVPELNFKEVDGALKIAASNNLHMRAHTLVWHSQTPSWFFSKDYDAEKVTDKKTMNARQDFYIHNVMYHTMNKEKALKGEAGSIVYAWDVVNEYLNRNSFNEFNWDGVYGKDSKNEGVYVKNAFKLAYAAIKDFNVTDKVTLFYNDFNTYFNPDAVLKLVEFINKDEDAKICGGIGMQSHIDIEVPTVAEYKETLDKFMASGYEINITELDFTINYDTKYKTYRYRDESQTDKDQAAYVKDFMEMVVKTQKNRDTAVNPKGITSLTLWGINDSMSWRGECSPLLFGELISDVKPSYFAFIEAAKAK